MAPDSMLIGLVRAMTSSDSTAVADLLARDPMVNCFVDSRVRIGGMDPWRLGGDLWGYFTNDRLHSMVYCGANLVPIATTDSSRAAFADRLRPMPRRCSSFVGPSDQVRDLWRLLEPAWGPAREERVNQPFLMMSSDPEMEADVRVRAVEMEEIDILMPSCIAMFTEEVGISPLANGNLGAYRSRITDLIRAGRAIARIEDGNVIFKAEIGSATAQACQVQGVWVAPSHRGRGLAAAGMAAVVEIARERIAPLVSLYVNDHNTPARKTYARVGFTQHETFASILF